MEKELRRPKRRRLVLQKPTPVDTIQAEHCKQEQPGDKHAVFTEWSRARGVKINGVEPKLIPGRGIGLVTIRQIKKNEQIIFVPEEAMFKPDVMLLKQRDLISASPQAQLTLSLMSALADEKAPMHTWTATWPSWEDFKASLPLFWSETSQWSTLLPPSTQTLLAKQRIDHIRDCGNLKSKEFDQRPSDETFDYLWAIVNSRSFHFQPPGSRAGFMVLCPFLDYINHGPSGTGINVNQSATGYAAKADRDYVGEEILATYGALSNDKLLVHYGFVCSSDSGRPSDDDFSLDHFMLEALRETVKVSLRDAGYLGAYALLPATNDICFRTQVAVRAQILETDEWEYFMTNGEDSSGDQSMQIKAWLTPLLEKQQDEAIENLRCLDKMQVSRQDSGPLSLLQIRWKQIQHALEAFLLTTRTEDREPGNSFGVDPP